MRVISRKTLKDFWEKHADSEQPLKAWFHEAKHADWQSFNDIKARYRSVDLLPGDRVVFKIKGNTKEAMQINLNICDNGAGWLNGSYGGGPASKISSSLCDAG